MIVIAIVGILAAIALPAYQDYTVRAKMSEPMAKLAEAKTTISEYYASTGDVPAAGKSGVAVSTTDSKSEIIAEVSYSAGTGADGIAVGVQVKADILGTAGWFQLSGTTQSDGTINWTCK